MTHCAQVRSLINSNFDLKFIKIKFLNIFSTKFPYIGNRIYTLLFSYKSDVRFGPSH